MLRKSVQTLKQIKKYVLSDKDYILLVGQIRVESNTRALALKGEYSQVIMVKCDKQ